MECGIEPVETRLSVGPDGGGADLIDRDDCLAISSDGKATVPGLVMRCRTWGAACGVGFFAGGFGFRAAAARANGSAAPRSPPRSDAMQAVGVPDMCEEASGAKPDGLRPPGDTRLRTSRGPLAGGFVDRPARRPDAGGRAVLRVRTGSAVPTGGAARDGAVIRSTFTLPRVAPIRRRSSTVFTCRLPDALAPTCVPSTATGAVSAGPRAEHASTVRPNTSRMMSLSRKRPCIADRRLRSSLPRGRFPVKVEWSGTRPSGPSRSEPAIGRVRVDVPAEPPPGSDAVQTADEQHPHHRLGIDRAPTAAGMMRRHLLPDEGQTEDRVDPAEPMAGRDAVLQPDLVERRSPTNPPSHHPSTLHHRNTPGAKQKTVGEPGKTGRSCNSVNSLGDGIRHEEYDRIFRQWPAADGTIDRLRYLLVHNEPRS